MTDDNNYRLIFRPTKIQYDRINTIYMNSGRYKHLSELLRHIVEEGLEKIEGEIKNA